MLADTQVLIINKLWILLFYKFWNFKKLINTYLKCLDKSYLKFKSGQ